MDVNERYAASVEVVKLKVAYNELWALAIGDPKAVAAHAKADELLSNQRLRPRQRSCLRS